MKNFRKLLLAIAIILAGLLSFLVYYYLQTDTVTVTSDSVNEYITVIVATESIPPRTRVTEEMVTSVKVLNDGFYQDYISSIDAIVGQYTKETILKGEGFRAERIIYDLDAELSLKVKDRFRAVSITVSHNTGVSDLIKAGDWIDLVVTLPELKEQERIVRPNLAIMLMQNIEVIAVDRELFRSEFYRIESKEIYTLTLSVPIQDVEKLVLAESIGTIKTILRPLDGDFIYNTDGAIWEELVLDDYYRIKDLFPQYEIAPSETVPTFTENLEKPIEKYIYYTVQYGDTLRSIAVKFYGTDEHYSLIKFINRIEDEDVIVVGTALKIPVIETEAGEEDEGPEN